MAPHTKLFECLRDGVEDNRAKALQEIDAVITSLDASIRTLRDNDTTADNQYLQELKNSRSKVLDERKKAVREFDKALSTMEQKQRDSLQQILDGLKQS
ncbi:MAG TPA: hypothetical protein DDW52_24695 [Planctomycetaceae bacterium]|nr:hypothetical protein [Planctomycetaceae bacterium]